jgi:hypothetical protein
VNAQPQSFDNLAVSVRKTPDGERYNYGVYLYGTFFIIGGFPSSGFEDDLTEAATRQGVPVEFPPTEAMQ